MTPTAPASCSPPGRRSVLRSERAAATLEFALILPIFLAVIGTVIFAGWLGTVKAILEHGASEGVRYAAIPSSADLRSYPTDPQVVAEVDAATPLLTPTGVQVESLDAGLIRGAPVGVRVTYQVQNPVALLFAPLELLGWSEPVPDSLTVTAYARTRRE
jgi:Flp pilus assembly protein TadG